MHTFSLSIVLGKALSAEHNQDQNFGVYVSSAIPGELWVATFKYVTPSSHTL
jgi:hypothetical protein